MRIGINVNGKEIPVEVDDNASDADIEEIAAQLGHKPAQPQRVALPGGGVGIVGRQGPADASYQPQPAQQYGPPAPQRQMYGPPSPTAAQRAQMNARQAPPTGFDINKAFAATKLGPNDLRVKPKPVATGNPVHDALQEAAYYLHQPPSPANGMRVLGNVGRAVTATPQTAKRKASDAISRRLGNGPVDPSVYEKDVPSRVLGSVSGFTDYLLPGANQVLGYAQAADIADQFRENPAKAARELADGLAPWKATTPEDAVLRTLALVGGAVHLGVKGKALVAKIKAGTPANPALVRQIVMEAEAQAKARGEGQSKAPITPQASVEPAPKAEFRPVAKPEPVKAKAEPPPKATPKVAPKEGPVQQTGPSVVKPAKVDETRANRVANTIDPSDEVLDPFSDLYDEPTVAALHRELFGVGPKMEGGHVSNEAGGRVRDEITRRQIETDAARQSDVADTDPHFKEEIHGLAESLGLKYRKLTPEQKMANARRREAIAKMTPEEQKKARQEDMMAKIRGGSDDPNGGWFQARKDRATGKVTRLGYGKAVKTIDLSGTSPEVAREIFTHALERGSNSVYVNGKEFAHHKGMGGEPSVYSLDEMITRDYHPDDVRAQGFDDWAKVHVPRVVVADYVKAKLSRISDAEKRVASEQLGYSRDEFEAVIAHNDSLLAAERAGDSAADHSAVAPGRPTSDAAATSRSLAQGNEPAQGVKPAEPPLPVKAGGEARRVNVGGEDHDLTGPAKKAYDEAEARFKAATEREYPDTLTGNAEKEAARKTAAEQFAKAKREIVGALTEKEAKAADLQANKVVAGTRVSTPSGPGIAKTNAFGKVTGTLDDGTPFSHPRAEVKPEAAPKVGPMEGAAKVARETQGKPEFVWELTRDEYRALPAYRGMSNGSKGEIWPDHVVDGAHRRQIEAAIQKGEPVPDRVLADYPDLKPKAKTPAEAPAAPVAKPKVESKPIRLDAPEAGPANVARQSGETPVKPVQAPESKPVGYAQQIDNRPAGKGTTPKAEADSGAKYLQDKGDAVVKAAVQKAAKGEAPLRGDEIGASLHRLRGMQNDLEQAEKAAAAGDEATRAALAPEIERLNAGIEEAYKAGDFTGNEWHKTGQALQVALKADYSLQRLQTRAKAHFDAEVPKAVADKIEALSARIKEQDAALSQARKDFAAQIEKMKAEKPRNVPTDRKTSVRNRNVANLKRFLGDEKGAQREAGVGGRNAGVVISKLPDAERNAMQAARQLAREAIEGGAKDTAEVLDHIRKTAGINATDERLLYLLSEPYRNHLLQADIARRQTDAYLRQLQKVALDRRKPVYQRFLSGAGQLYTGLQRPFQAGLDISAPFIQGRKGLFASPGSWVKAWGPMLNALRGGEKAADVIQAQIRAHPLYARAKTAGLEFTEHGGSFTAQEETFAGNLIDTIRNSKVPGAKQYAEAIARSDFAFNAFMNRLKMDTFAKMAQADPTNPAYLRDISGTINTIYGRGASDLAKKVGSIPLAGNTIYAPRYAISGFEYAGFRPLYSAETALGRKAALKVYAAQAAAYGGIVALARMAGWDVETDARSTDFGKVFVWTGKERVGVDLFAKEGQAYRLFAQVLAGKINQKGDYTRASTYSSTGVAAQFVTGKMSPAAKAIVEPLFGVYDEAAGGTRPYEAKDFGLGFVPLWIQSAAKDDKWKTVPYAIPGDLAGLNSDVAKSRKDGGTKVPLEGPKTEK